MYAQAKIQIRLLESESSFGSLWISKDATFIYAIHEESGRTARIRRLIWVFVGSSQTVWFAPLQFINDKIIVEHFGRTNTQKDQDHHENI